MKRIIIRESSIPIVSELSFICESQESKSIEQAKKYCMANYGWSSKRADDYVRNDIRSMVRPLKSKKGGKFILGVTRLSLDNEIVDTESITSINNIIRFLCDSKYYDEFDKNLNGMSLRDLEETFSDDISKMLDASKNELSSKTYDGNKSYEIVKIDSFDESKQYSKYTDWCITTSHANWSLCTNNDANQFYFCLKHGFENVPREVGENCPLDEYGLSMLAICVSPTGDLVSCTSRWNHKVPKGISGDMVMNVSQISEVIGENFYDAFKPSKRLEEALEEFLELYRSGKATETDKIKTSNFDDGTETCIIEYNEASANIMSYDGNTIFLKRWVPLVNKADEHGFRRIRNGDDTQNIFDGVKKKMVFDKPVNAIGLYHKDEDYMIVGKEDENGKLSNIFRKGTRSLISNEWFTELKQSFYSYNGRTFTVQTQNGEYNIFSLEKNSFLFKKNFSKLSEVLGDGKRIGCIDINGNEKKVIIDMYDNINPKEAFDKISDYNYYSLSRIVMLNGKCNIVNEEGKTLKDWHDKIYVNNNGFYTVYDANPNGELSIAFMIDKNNKAYDANGHQFDPFV